MSTQPTAPTREDFYSMFWDMADEGLRHSLCTLATPRQLDAVAVFCWDDLIDEQRKALCLGIRLLLDAHVHNRRIARAKLEAMQQARAA